MGQKTTSSSSKKRKADHHHGKSNKSSKSGSSNYKNNKSSGGEQGLSAKSQKRALKQERQSQRKHADIVIEAKQLWNKLRLKSNTKDDTRQMTQQLMTLIKGKVNEISLQHDASRVVQAALQFGTVEERQQVMKELTQASLLELAKNQYAHYVVLKSIKYCYNDKECVKMIVKSFKGHIPKLAVHATGSKIVEALFQAFPTKSIAVLQQEFYGPHFALFASDVLANDEKIPTNLAAHLAKSPDKKEVALTFVRNILEKGIEKSLVGYTYYQELFAEYVANCTPLEIRSIAPSIVDHSIHLLSSKAGTRVVLACASYGTAKDRKRIQKNLKGYTKSALLHKDGYLALLRLVQVTDDTVSTQKNTLNELLVSSSETNNKDEEETSQQQLPALLEIALNGLACKLFLMLLASTDDSSWKKIFDPYELELLDPNPVVIEKDGVTKTPTRRKDPERHRQELLQYSQKPLLELCTNHPQELMFSLSGSALIREVYNTWHSKDLVDSIVQVCVSDLDNAAENKKKKKKGDDDEEDEDDDDDDLALFEDRVGHLAIKNMILCDVEENNDKGASLAQEFFDQLKDRLMEVAKSNRGAFVVAALCKVPTVREEALKKLKKKTAKLKKLADDTTEGEGSSSTAGYKALLKEIEGN